MNIPRSLDRMKAGEHVAVGELCVAADVIVVRKWWQFWRPLWWTETRLCLVLADRSLLDVTPLMRGYGDKSRRGIRAAYEATRPPNLEA